MIAENARTGCTRQINRPRDEPSRGRFSTAPLRLRARRPLPAAALLIALLATTLLGCATRPVPELEREVSELEGIYRAALYEPDPIIQVRSMLALRASTLSFIARLDGERVVLPSATAHGSTATGSGGGMFRFEQRDVASVRSKGELLRKRVDRFLKTTAVERLAGTGFAISENELIQEAEASDS